MTNSETGDDREARVKTNSETGTVRGMLLTVSSTTWWVSAVMVQWPVMEAAVRHGGGPCGVPGEAGWCTYHGG